MTDFMVNNRGVYQNRICVQINVTTNSTGIVPSNNHRTFNTGLVAVALAMCLTVAVPFYFPLFLVFSTIIICENNQQTLLG